MFAGNDDFWEAMGTLQFKLYSDLGDFTLDAEAEIDFAGVCALFGRSGSGKTSLLRCLAGLNTAVQGDVRFGENVWLKGRKQVPTHQRNLAYVFQEGNLFSHLSVEGNLNFARKRAIKKLQLAQEKRVLNTLRIQGLMQRKIYQLSGGERQRVAIARALLSNPILLLMDEPLVALDEEHKQEILAYLQQLFEAMDIAVIYVSHALGEVVKLCNTMLVIEKGKLVDQGAVNQCLARLGDITFLDHGTGVVVNAKLIRHLPGYALSELDLGGQSIRVKKIDKPCGDFVRLHLRAKDISICLNRDSQSSILNILSANIASITVGCDEAMCRVTLHLDGATDEASPPVALVALISKWSLEHLELKKGQQVFAQIKVASLVD